MRTFVTALIVAGTASLPAGADLPAGQAESWPIVAAQSTVRIHVGKSGLFSFAGHEHEIEAPALSGHVRFDPADLAQSDVQVTFDAAALRVDPAREPSGDAPKVQSVMAGPEVLDVARFPTIALRSTGVRIENQQGANAKLRIAGELTLRGVSRPVTVPVDVVRSDTSVKATGTFKVKQSDYGIKPVSAGMGTVRVKDEVEVRFTIVAARGTS
jgi:polyisoprenoid-binding protein YceI